MMRSTVSVLCIILALLALSVTLVREAWINLRIQQVQRPVPVDPSLSAVCTQSTSPQMILVGDSRVSRWPMQMFGIIDVVNRGIGGEGLVQLESRYQATVLNCHPAMVVLETGVNDLVAASLIGGAKADEIVSNVTAAFFRLAEKTAQTGVQIYVATVIPPARPDLLRRLVWSRSLNTYVARVNARLRSHRWSGATHLVDFARALDPDDTGELADIFRLDTLHLNTAGYGKLMCALSGVIEDRTFQKAFCRPPEGLT